MNLHSDCDESLKIGKKKVIVKYGCEVKQGNNLSPALFMIVMQLVEEIIKVINHDDIVLPKIICARNRKGVLKFHRSKDIMKIVDNQIRMCMHVDYGYFYLTLEINNRKGTR